MGPTFRLRLMFTAFQEHRDVRPAPLSKDHLGDALNYLKENATCNLLMYGDEPVGVELPAAVELTVTETDPWVRGDTAQGGTKPAKLETGIMVNVPSS